MLVAIVFICHIKRESNDKLAAQAKLKLVGIFLLFTLAVIFPYTINSFLRRYFQAHGALNLHFLDPDNPVSILYLNYWETNDFNRQRPIHQDEQKQI